MMNAAELFYHRAPAWLQTVMLNVHAYRIERHRYGASYRAEVDRLRERERWAPERLRAYQDARLRTVIATAYERSPYYRAVMDGAGVYPGDVRGVEDLARLPLLTKPVVRARGRELMTQARPRRGWLHGHTSGTTGSPLGVWYDRNTCIVTNAVDRQHKLWAGMQEGDWIGLLLGRVVVPPDRSRPPFWRANLVHRQVWFSSFHLSEENLEHYVREIERRRLRFLEGYPSTLFILAQHLLQRGRTLPMRAVISSSETLHAIQRQAIETAFECRLFDFYALAERVIYAGECDHHAGKHLAESYGITEVVDEHGAPVPDGQAGYLVGTSLHNTAMPMIRYRTGDISAIVPEPCPCGRTGRRIRGVATKAEDIVVTPEGRRISPSVLTHPFKPLEQILASQIIQESLDRVLVKIVPSAAFTTDHERALAASLGQRLGPGIDIEIRQVDEIPREPSGKFRWVISRVEHACTLSWDDVGEGDPAEAPSAAAGGRP